MNKILLASAGATLLALGVAPSACAELEFYRDRLTFNAATSRLTLEDFETNNLSFKTIVEFPSPLNNTTNNAAFSPNNIEPGISFSAVGSESSRLDLVNKGVLGVPSDVIGPSSFASDLQIDFTTSINAVGFDLLADLALGTVVIEIYGANGLLGAKSLIVTDTPTFWGVISDSDSITQIVILNRTPAEVNLVGKLIDNVAFGTASPQD